jgi:arylformamidase
VLDTHTGTHVDAPKHFIDDGPGADQLALDLLIGPARVIASSGAGGAPARVVLRR